MPRYLYECEKCGQFEVDQRINDPVIETHEKCGCKVERLITRSSFSLKGAGWARDGYASSHHSDKGSNDG